MFGVNDNAFNQSSFSQPRQQTLSCMQKADVKKLQVKDYEKSLFCVWNGANVCHATANHKKLDLVSSFHNWNLFSKLQSYSAITKLLRSKLGQINRLQRTTFVNSFQRIFVFKDDLSALSIQQTKRFEFFKEFLCFSKLF